MKRSIVAILAALVTTLSSQAEIVYVNGPSFQIGGGTVDFDSDSVPDVIFWNNGPICTMDVPSSACYLWFSVGAAQTSQLLLNGSEAMLLTQGAWVGSNAPSGGFWSSPGQSGSLFDWFWSERYGTGGQSGPLPASGVGYLGVQFNAADGLHFGWIRVRMPLRTMATNGFPLEIVPVVVDWAYETRTNTPICAGATGSDSDSVQFKVEFFDTSRKHRNPNRHVGTGTFILTDNTLRGELTLAGEYSSADIQGPSHPHAKTKPIWSFGSPLVSRTNYTAFFGEVTLTRTRLIQLARGTIYVSIDDGDVLGLIVPIKDNAKRRR